MRVATLESETCAQECTLRQSTPDSFSSRRMVMLMVSGELGAMRSTSLELDTMLPACAAGSSTSVQLPAAARAVDMLGSMREVGRRGEQPRRVAVSRYALRWLWTSSSIASVGGGGGGALGAPTGGVGGWDGWLNLPLMSKPDAL